MRIDELKSIIQKDIILTKEYDAFLKQSMPEVLTELGKSHMEHLHFFNIGYQMALERIISLVDALIDPIEKSLADLQKCEEAND